MHHAPQGSPLFLSFKEVFELIKRRENLSAVVFWAVWTYTFVVLFYVLLGIVSMALLSSGMLRG